MESIIQTHLWLAFSGCFVLVTFSRFLVPLLFSREFKAAVEMLPLMSVGILGFVFTWSYNSLLLHFGKHREFVFIDSLWMFFYLAAVFALARSQASPALVALAYPLAGIVSAALYVSLIRLKCGRGYFSWKNAVTAITCASVLLATLYLTR